MEIKIYYLYVDDDFSFNFKDRIQNKKRFSEIAFLALTMWNKNIMKFFILSKYVIYLF